LAPEAHLAEVGRAIGAELRRQVGGAGVVPAMVCWRTRLPLPLGDGAVELYRRDPAVAAAMAAAEAAGEPATAWVARHQGRVERLVRDAARDAAGFGAAVPWAELGGGWQPDQGRWAGWPGSVADATRRQLGETLSFPSMAGHDWAHRDGGGTPADDLTRLLAQVAGGQRLGVVRVLPMVPAWDPEPLPGWTAVLAMLGADGVVVEDPALAALRADDRSGAVLPPALHRALALTRWLVDLRADHPGFTDWPLVAADEPHPYRADSPILPLWRLLVAGDAGAVVIARRRPDGAVLVLGWAPDGRDRTVRVDLPGRPGTVVRCSPLGAVRLLPTP
jgi:hypothetical protein